jgi:hypothetical protein
MILGDRQFGGVAGYGDIGAAVDRINDLSYPSATNLVGRSEQNLNIRGVRSRNMAMPRELLA